MSSTKAALKAAKSALDSQDFGEAASQAQKVIDIDPQNYFGNVFLGRALEKQDKIQPAIDAYKAATKIKPEDELAWKGLCNAYEFQGSQGVDGFTSAALELAKLYAEKSDHHQCQTYVNKLVAFAKAKGTREQYKQALEVMIPSSPVFGFLEGYIPNPSFTFTRLAEITELEESEKINKEIGERRTRLGAKLSQVTAEVTREVFAKSQLEHLYRDIINWTADDEIRRGYEEKLFKRAYDHLVALPLNDKAEKLDQVMKMARDIVIIKHPLLLAWQLNLEWKDLSSLSELDFGILRDFIFFFPTTGLSKIFQGYLGESIQDQAENKQINGAIEDKDTEEASKLPPLTAQERLFLLVDGLDDCKDSAIAHRIMSEHYLQIEEYESCVETARRCLQLLQDESRKSGLSFERNYDAVNTGLATSLVYYQSPKNHIEAENIFNEILKREPNSTAALLGSGLILEEQMEFEKASTYLDRALERDPENVRVGTEAAWCKALTGDYPTGLESLESFLPKLNAPDLRDVKALTLYRIGRCVWELKPDKASRRNRHGAYAHFIASLKANPTFAPTYTSLGEFYADYAKDKKRARQCFQKAFDLSGSEVGAAERLARAFADDGDWDIVEIIAQRVIDSGVVRPSPGSKRKGISWPFAALGVVQINKQEYPKSVVSFQSALRISPLDYHSWVGLGESYHSSGRYVAARRTLEHAQSLAPSVSAESRDQAWFAQYMLSNILRELGEYEEALKGYREVSTLKPKEFGVSIALLQTLIERAWHSVETGFFGLAAQSATEAVKEAKKMLEDCRHAFNYWKAVGDACALFTSLPGHFDQTPLDEVKSILSSDTTSEGGSELDFDGITSDVMKGSVHATEQSRSGILENILYCSILAFKQAVFASSEDKHAQAVAWYNLGWMEYKASTLLKQIQNGKPSKKATKTLKAAVRCFKGAIELEAGNADFWNALGVVTTEMSPSVAQHSFVRSLHLNERSPRTWTNLGTLYLVQNDNELAHEAFSRAQSTGPDYAQAWVGEGLVALLLGNVHEALSHFTHAAEIADASSISTKSHYVVAAFDNFLTSSADSTNVVRPIFALQQLQVQAIRNSQFEHLISLMQERVGDYETAIKNLEKVCAEAEAKYEDSEDATDLGQFAIAKADLARNQVSLGEYELASENAEVALDLTSEDESAGLSPAQRLKMRLSAHMTLGLTKYNLGEMDEAIDTFRTALEESDSTPDVVCLLAQVLWAKGSENERNVARDQLFECIEKHPGHPQATQLIGAMSAVEEDRETNDAVTADLRAMRTSEKLNHTQKRSLESLIATLTALHVDLSGDLDMLTAEAKASIMLSPSRPDTWSALAKASSDPFAAEMALRTAAQSVPPNGSLDAQELSKAFAKVPSIANAQKSIMVYPWGMTGWESLSSCTE